MLLVIILLLLKYQHNVKITARLCQSISVYYCSLHIPGLTTKCGTWPVSGWLKGLSPALELDFLSIFVIIVRYFRNILRKIKQLVLFSNKFQLFDYVIYAYLWNKYNQFHCNLKTQSLLIGSCKCCMHSYVYISTMHACNQLANLLVFMPKMFN